MAAPATGVASLAKEHSDPNLTRSDLKSPKPVEGNLIVPQVSKTSHIPFTPSSGKRRKTKPVRFEASRTDVQKEPSPSKLKIVVHDPSSPRLSFPTEKSPTKGLKALVPSSPAVVRAREVQSSLGTKFPSCMKSMVRSHVTSGFWMGLPLPFCKSFLPKEDTTFVLEDENGEQYEVKYIAYKSGLSAGWKRFAVGHNLLEGDVLVFHLAESCKFKVYIIRANDSKEVDGALNLLNLEAHAEQMTPVTPSPTTKRSKRPKSLRLTVVQKRNKRSAPSQRSSSEEVGSEVLEGSRPPKLEPSFQKVRTFEDFRIVVNGMCIDTELPSDVRTSYYRLCLDKNQFLHDDLPEGLYFKLVAGMIGETVSIANEIKNCKITTTMEEFEAWDNSLKSFEILGMKVGFLRDRIRTLVRLVSESEGVVDMKRYVEAKNEQKHTEDEITKFAAKLLELKETARKFKGVLRDLRRKAVKHEHKFKEEVDAPW